MDWLAVIEWTAAAFGLLCVVLTIRRSIWCWPTGLIQVALYVWIFYQVKLYSDLGLHLIYVVLQVYGWQHWSRGGPRSSTLPVTTLPLRRTATWGVAVLAGSLAWGGFMARTTDAALPYPDAFTTVASLAAQWLMARKKVESWYFWIAVDVVAIPVYLIKALYPTAALYAIFLVLAIVGLRAWRCVIETDPAGTDEAQDESELESRAGSGSGRDDRTDAGQVRPAAPGTPASP